MSYEKLMRKKRKKEEKKEGRERQEQERKRQEEEMKREEQKKIEGKQRVQDFFKRRDENQKRIEERKKKMIEIVNATDLYQGTKNDLIKLIKESEISSRSHLYSIIRIEEEKEELERLKIKESFSEEGLTVEEDERKIELQKKYDPDIYYWNDL